MMSMHMFKMLIFDVGIEFLDSELTGVQCL